jgi:ribosomal protein L16 Arg81 hydroxylase
MTGSTGVPGSGPLLEDPSWTPIERRTDLSPEEFRERYVGPDRPVVLAQGAPGWKERWTLDSLRARHGAALVRGHTTELNINHRKMEDLPLERLLDRIQSGQRFALRTLDVFELLPRLRDEVNEVPLLTERYFGPSFPLRRMSHNLWVAPAGNTSSFHHDLARDNLNIQVYGEKLFLLTEPSSHPWLRPGPTTRFGVMAGVDPFSPADRRGALRDVRVLCTRLAPGDAIYIPRFWWHCVRAVCPSINWNTFAHRRDLGNTWRILAALPRRARWAAFIASVIEYQLPAWHDAHPGRYRTPFKGAEAR